MHKTINTNKALFFIDNKTGKRGVFISATGQEYKTRTNAKNALYIIIKGKRYYFIKADGCPLYDFDFNLSYCN